METVVSPPVEPELHLLTTWGQPDDGARRRKAAIATFLFHAAAATTLFLLPESFFESKRLPDVATHITPIFEPLTPLTQKAPNLSKTQKEFSVEERGAHGQVTQPSRPVPAAPPAPKPQPALAAAQPGPKPATAPPPVKKAEIPPPPKQQAAPPTPEPPAVNATAQTPKIDLPQISTLPSPPKIETQEQPKLALQNLNQGPPTVLPPDQRRAPLPDTSVSGAIQRSLQDAAPKAAAAPAGESQNLQLPQLLSDAQGVDFTSYLRRILQMVKRNWQVVIPTESRFGRPGKVSLVLSIARNGKIIKMVYAQQSGASLPDAYDKAAVQGVSMTQEEGFPPFPPEFKGDQIVVQFNFAYNTPRK